jgi:cell division protein FtsW
MARSRPRTKPPLEYSLIYTATLCMLALGAIMVYSASSAESLLDGSWCCTSPRVTGCV